MSHNLPSIEVKTWILTFKKNGYGHETVEVRKPEYLTETKAKVIQRFLHDPRTRFLDLTDDKGNLKEVIEKKEIESLKLISDTVKNNAGDVWLCGYGVRHPMHVWPPSACGCREKFGMLEIFFLQEMQRRHAINHSHEITDFMREEFLREQSLLTA